MGYSFQFGHVVLEHDTVDEVAVGGVADGQVADDPLVAEQILVIILHNNKLLLDKLPERPLQLHRGLHPLQPAINLKRQPHELEHLIEFVAGVVRQSHDVVIYFLVLALGGLHCEGVVVVPVLALEEVHHFCAAGFGYDC